MTEDISNVASGFTIAFLILAFLLLAAGRARIALPVAFLGIVGVSFTTIWRTFPSPRIAEFQDKIAGSEKELASLKGRADHLERALNAKTAELQAHDQNWRQQVDRLAGELAALAERFDRLLAVLNQDKPPPKANSHPPLSLEMLNKLAVVIEARQRTVVTPSFQISFATDNQLVMGRKGSYYVVRPLDPSTKRQFVFAEREYALSGGPDGIVKALQQFKTAVLDGLDEVARVEIFLRGGADVRSFEAQWGTGGPPPPVLVLKLGESGVYAADPQMRGFGQVLRNDDLPDLRAAYVAKLLQSTVGISTVHILSNAPARDDNELHRTVEIILFVGW